MSRIAVVGIGRIGKLLLRELADEGLLDQVVLVSDAVGDCAQHAHLLTFDTVHGRFAGQVSAGEDTLSINGHEIVFHSTDRIESLPLAGHAIDLVIDCTGAYRTNAALEPYFNAGVKRVVVSAPVKEADAVNIVYGINHERYDPSVHRVVTAASCTTNCLAPLVKVMHEGLGIRHASMTTLHNVTNTQTMVDRPAKDLRRARSALNSLIPTSTGSATAITLIYPELKGRIDGHAVRVPLLNASLTDVVFEVDRATTVEEVNALFDAAAVGSLEGILGVEHRPLVSADYINEPRSAVLDALSTLVTNGTQVKLYAWYDNEWGYTRRLGDIARLVAAA
jgi:glyceraldehyde 3-phosphate dehydrogenase